MSFASSTCNGIAGWFLSLRSWKRWSAALILGALIPMSQPPVHLMPVLFVSFTGLVWLVDGTRTWRSAFGVGWLFGAGYHACGLYWVSEALLVDASRFAWLIPFNFFGLSLGLGLFTGIMALVARLFWRPGISRIFVLAGMWTLFEGLRGILFTGFPWNPVGNAWVAFDSVLQVASWIGVYGLSLVTVYASAAVALMANHYSIRHRTPAAASGLAVLMVLAIAGFVRLDTAATPLGGGHLIRLVQPNIAQRDKWRPELIASNFARHLRLSKSNGGKRPLLVVWPETAVSADLLANSAAQTLLREVIPEDGLLITGALRLVQSPGRPIQAFNSLVALDSFGRVQNIYDKHHLVPFGEYVPLRSVLPLNKISEGNIDFTPGRGPATLRLPGISPFGPLICYEVIFPGEVVARGDRPDWLLNVTNDAWFGQSAGPHQHFSSARMRAVEEGLPLVRVANTGISGVVDAHGRVIATLALGFEGALNVILPPPAAPTLFSRFGNLIPGTLIWISFIFAFVTQKRGL